MRWGLQKKTTFEQKHSDEESVEQKNEDAYHCVGWEEQIHCTAFRCTVNSFCIHQGRIVAIHGFNYFRSYFYVLCRISEKDFEWSIFILVYKCQLSDRRKGNI